MKKLFIVSLLCVTFHPPIFSNFSKPEHDIHYQSNRKYVKGYVLRSGNFTEVSLTVELDETGRTWIVTEYRFTESIGNQNYQRGICHNTIYTLNQRNNMAVNYNFTHYSEILSGTVAYFRL